MTHKFDTKTIPALFVKNLPEGLKILSKKGKSFVVVDDLRCPRGHSLLSDEIKFHGAPAIGFTVKGGGIQGKMYLDPFWGLHEKLYDFMFQSCDKPPIIRAFCPECGVSLMKKKKCETRACCAEEYIVFHLPGGNAMESCAQWGCPEHSLKISDMPGDVMAAVKKINYPEIHSHIEAIGF
ncbi:MAG: hypothetical protein V1913_00485 [Fibrobacterota bacterium]